MNLTSRTTSEANRYLEWDIGKVSRELRVVLQQLDTDPHNPVLNRKMFLMINALLQDAKPKKSSSKDNAQ